jgi:hypothetical protein
MIEKEQIIIPLISAAAATLLIAQSTPNALPHLETTKHDKIAGCWWPFCSGDHKTVIIIPLIEQKLQYTSWSRSELYVDQTATRSLFD